VWLIIAKTSDEEAECAATLEGDSSGDDVYCLAKQLALSPFHTEFKLKI